jgi:hypothetical protein
MSIETTIPAEHEPEDRSTLDRIGDALPDPVRADYYREMMHFRDLPENDEVLRIIRIMGFLTILIEQVPSLVLSEREKFEAICHEVISTAKRLEATGNDYYQKLDKQLAELPGEVAKGINPTAFSERIIDDLKNLFNRSTVPTIANELADNARYFKAKAEEFRKASEQMSGAARSALADANKAIGSLGEAIEKASDEAWKAVERIESRSKEKAEILDGVYTDKIEKIERSALSAYRWFIGYVIYICITVGITAVGLVFYLPRMIKESVIEAVQESQQSAKSSNSTSKKGR